MNILYVVMELHVIEPQGVMQLSAITKALGHQSFLGVIKEDDIPDLIQKEKIDLVAFSVASTEASIFLSLAQDIRALGMKTPIIAGGPHPTYFPNIVDTWPIDAIVLGEGDESFAEIVTCLAAGKDYASAPNVHTKQQKNPQRPLIADLDKLPYLDRELVHDRASFRNIRMNSFMATRGCTNRCSYCFNSSFAKLYPGTKLRRRRSVQNLIGEVEQVKQKYGLDFVRFGDDVFVDRHDDWVKEFVQEYPKRIGIPFSFFISPSLLTDELMGVLKKAGAHSVGISIETGNEKIRRTILRRNVSDASLREAYRIVNAHGIKSLANSMLGLPGATLEDDLDNIKMAFELNPTFASFTVFAPFPGTELYEYALEYGFLDKPISYDDTFQDSVYQSSVLSHVDKKRKDIHQNILSLAPLANWIPFLRPLIIKHLRLFKVLNG